MGLYTSWLLWQQVLAANTDNLSAVPESLEVQTNPNVVVLIANGSLFLVNVRLVSAVITPAVNEVYRAINPNFD